MSELTMAPVAFVGSGCYLIHFDQPYKHARHYLGYADDIAARLKRHRTGAGARLLAVIQAQGIGWTLVRQWENAGRDKERSLKNRHSTQLCPICNPPKTKERRHAL